MSMKQIAALAALGVLTLSACNSSTGGASTPALTPTNSDTPTANVSSAAPSSTAPSSSPTTSSSSASTSTSASSISSIPADLAAAQKVQKDVLDLEFHLYTRGGLSAAVPNTPSMTNILMGDALKKTRDSLNTVWAAKIKYQSGQPQITGSKVADVAPHQASTIALQSCRDLSGIKFTHNNEQYVGGTFIYTAWFTRDTDGKLKMSDWSEQQVTSC